MFPFSEENDLDQTRDRSVHAQRAAESDARLEALVGGPKQPTTTRVGGSDAAGIAALVDTASAGLPSSAVPVVNTSAVIVAEKKTRGHRRIDWINATTAAVAVVAAIGAAVFAGAQIANASPAGDAVQVLTTEEATLAGAESSLVTSTARLEEKIQSADADVAPLRAALSALVETPEQPATADAAALDAAIVAVDNYRTALSEIVLPDLPRQYTRGTIDEESLESVGEAIDRVHLRSADVAAVTEELRTVRKSFDTLTDAYNAQLATFAATFTANAVAELEANTSAGDDFRNAVTAAAAKIVATPLDGTAGVSALNAYRGAVLALRAEDLRVRTAEAEEADRLYQEQLNQNNWSDDYWYEAPQESTDAPVTTDTGTTDSGATEPVTPDPVKTDPVDTGDTLPEG